MKDSKAFLDACKNIQFSLWMSDFFTCHANGSLTTDASNLEASRAWEGQLLWQLRMGPFVFSLRIRVFCVTVWVLRC
jgi:hypothetical protein